MAGKTGSFILFFAFQLTAFSSFSDSPKVLGVFQTAQIDNSTPVISKTGKINTVDGLKWKAVFDKGSPFPRMMYGGLSRGDGEPLKIAYDFLKTNGDLFGIEDPNRDIRVSNQIKSPGTTHVIFVQNYAGLPVLDSSIGVHISNNGTVELVTNSFKDPKEIMPELIERRISMDEAELIAQRHLGPAKEEKLRIEQGFIKNGKGFSRVWRIYYPTHKPSGDWLLDVDYFSGAIHRLVNANKFATGIGLIHAPNPLTSPQRSTVNLTNLVQPGPEDNFLLRGLFFEITNGKSAPAGEPVPEFDYAYAFDERIKDEPEESDPRYEEVTAYYYMESFRSYCRDLGFQLFGNYRIKACAHGSDMDLSWYSHEEKSITFGDGGVNDASDADIIIHELGHAVVDFVKPDIFYATGETAAIHEGYSDYFAASFLNDPCLMEWDSHILKMPYLRTVNNSKRYPQDSKGASHDAGGIWSGTLWDIRNELMLKESSKGKAVADSLALKSIYYLPDNNPTFKETGIALQIASTNLYNGRYNNVIKKVLKERGLL